MNALVNIETLTAEKLFAPGGVEEIISKLESDVRALPMPDISTESGREEIKSLAYKIARSKTGLDALGKDHVAVLKKQAGTIDAQRRIICDRLDTLKDEVRKPVTDWENSEKARADGHESALAQIRNAAELDIEPSSLTIEARLRLLGQIAQRDWQEFAAQSNGALAVAEDKLRAALAVAHKREADAAELKRLQAAEASRVEAEAKARRDADAATAAATAEAERAKAAEIAGARAVEQERQRVAAEKASALAAEQKRQANKRHREKIHKEITAALVALEADIPNEGGDNLINFIVGNLIAGKIPHVTINY